MLDAWTHQAIADRSVPLCPGARALRRHRASCRGRVRFNGEDVGRSVTIDKVSGKVAYAVISFGGFLGMGEDYYPMPWPNLKYDTRLGGYRVGVTEDQLKGAPKYRKTGDWNWSDRANDQRVYDYYNTPLWY